MNQIKFYSLFLINFSLLIFFSCSHADEPDPDVSPEIPMETPKEMPDEEFVIVDSIKYKFIDVDKVEVLPDYLNESYEKYSISRYEGDIIIPEEIAFEDRYFKVTSIGEEAFNHCPITSISLPLTLVEIKNSAFANCQNLKEIQIPENVEYIGEEAFNNCRKLEVVKLSKSLRELGACAFQYTDIRTIDMPENLTALNGNTFRECKELQEITLPEALVQIGDYDFIDCKALKKFVAPESLEIIGTMAFEGCSGLESVYLDSKINNIQGGAFAYTPSLKYVVCMAPQPPIVIRCEIRYPTPMTENFYYNFDNRTDLDIFVLDNCIEFYESDSFWKYLSLQPLSSFKSE